MLLLLRFCTRRIAFALMTAALYVVGSVSAEAQECEIIDFDNLNLEHGDAVTSLSLFGGTLSLTLDAIRNDPAGAVDPTAYDTERWDNAGDPPPGTSHDDTQRAIGCNPAQNGGLGECDGFMLVVPDEFFGPRGDDTQGGFITLSGFDGQFEILSYAAVDSDNTDRDVILRVGPGLVQVGTSTGLGNGTVETVVTDPHSFSGQAEFEFEGSGGIDDIEICMDEPPPEGCTPGYWKQEHHFASWVGFAPDDDYETVFGVDASFDLTLLGALTQGGGGEQALGRAAVAALLNASSDDVAYFDTVAGVISRVQAAYASGDFEGVKDLLDEENNAGCPLDNACGIGFELALLLPPLMWAYGRRRRLIH
jgi:hypothetical protein